MTWLRSWTSAGDPVPRAFRREGLASRMVPLSIAMAFAFVWLLALGPVRDLRLALYAVGFMAALVATVIVVPWDRLPRWTDILPPLAALVLVAALFRRLGPGLPSVTAAPFFLIPTFWVALHGTRLDVVVMLAAVAVVRFGVAFYREWQPGELGYAGSAFVIAATVCIATNQVVRRKRAAARSMRALLEAMPVGVAVYGDEQVRFANRHLATLLGYADASALVGRTALSLFHPDERASGAERMSMLARGQDPAAIDRRLLHAAGGEVLVETRPMSLHFEGRPAIGVVIRDVTDERLLAAAETELRQAVATERERLLAVFESVEDGISVVDSENRGVYCNPAYSALFGIEARRFRGIGKEAFLSHLATLSDTPDELLQRFAGASTAVGPKVIFELARPRRRVLRRSVARLRLEGGEGFVVVWHDITAEHDLAAERERLVGVDPLTGVMNRRGVNEALAREVARARRQQGALSVALIDIDHFKRVNDTLGHDAGDATLVAFADVLRAQARITDIVARWGGEEFLAVLPGNIAGARAFCERVRDALAHLDVPRVGRITVSAGVAELEPGDDGTAAVARADAHLYDAKRAGRDRVAG